MEKLNLVSIGTVCHKEERYVIEVAETFAPALEALGDFRWVMIVWWFDQCDTPLGRSRMVEHSPYKGGPSRLGVFATRSPERPNPVAVSCAEIICINGNQIEVAYIDAADGSPLLDIKPYMPSLDRVAQVEMPEWCAGWPDSIEKSGDFDWSRVFNFES